MSNSITELLANILAAKYGEEVRGSIHDAIELCYQDGKAGVNDLQARQLIEAVAEVNEQQAAALEVLQARVEELESGEGGSSQQSTTIDIPTVLVDGGVVENVSVNNNSTTTRHITFTTEFTETPKVMVAIGKNVGAVSQYGYLSANILYPTVTTTGFDFFLANRTGSDRSPGVVWYAYQPTVKTIDLDITIPETEGMTEAEVREITGPIAAAVDALKTGYDGTSYQTAAEAVRTQINDLHVLIGDEPGTAISADSIGYEDGSVADALTGLNERLEDYASFPLVLKNILEKMQSEIKACYRDDTVTSNEFIDDTDALIQNLNSLTPVLQSISATYSGGDVKVGTPVANLTGIAVTGLYSNGRTESLTGWAATGTIVEGDNVITITYEELSTTITVTGVVKALGLLIPKGAKTQLVTAKRHTGIHKSRISMQIDEYTGSDGIYLYYVNTSGIAYINGEAKNYNTISSSTLDIVCDKPLLTDIVGKGKVDAYFDSSALSYDNSYIKFSDNRKPYGADTIIYKITILKDSDDSVVYELIPSETPGTMVDKITGTEFTFSDTTGMQVIEEN